MLRPGGPSGPLALLHRLTVGDTRLVSTVHPPLGRNSVAALIENPTLPIPLQDEGEIVPFPAPRGGREEGAPVDEGTSSPPGGGSLRVGEVAPRQNKTDKFATDAIILFTAKQQGTLSEPGTSTQWFGTSKGQHGTRIYSIGTA